jgi:hypothetical protein
VRRKRATGGTDLAAEFLGDAERQRRLTRGGRASEEQRPAGHLLLANHVDHQPGRLPRSRLPHEPRSHRYRHSICLQETQTEQ